MARTCSGAQVQLVFVNEAHDVHYGLPPIDQFALHFGFRDGSLHSRTDRLCSIDGTTAEFLCGRLNLVDVELSNGLKGNFEKVDIILEQIGLIAHKTNGIAGA